jgi:hypothetical protein
MKELRPPDSIEGWTTEVTCKGCNAEYLVEKSDFDHFTRGRLFGINGNYADYNYIKCPRCDLSIKVNMPYQLSKEIAARPYPNPKPDPPSTHASCPHCGGSGKNWLRRRCSRCLGEGTVGYGGMGDV